MSLIEKVSPFQNQTVRHLELLEAFRIARRTGSIGNQTFSKLLVFFGRLLDIDRKLQDSGNLIYFYFPVQSTED